MTIYVYDIEKDEYGFGTHFTDNASIRAVLSDWRYAKTSVIKNEKAKKLSFMAGMLFQKGMKDIYGIDKDDIVINENEYGCPKLVGKDIHFSISHAGIFVAVAFSDKETGVDIEHKDDRGGLITRRMFTENERQHVESADNEEEVKKRFLFVWTRKESYLKYIGEGIRRPLISFDVMSGEELGVVFETKEISGYTLSLCMPDGSEEKKWISLPEFSHL